MSSDADRDLIVPWCLRRCAGRFFGAHRRRLGVAAHVLLVVVALPEGGRVLAPTGRGTTEVNARTQVELLLESGGVPPARRDVPSAPISLFEGLTPTDRPRIYAETAFKAGTVELIRSSGETATELCRDLDLTETSVRRAVA